MRLLFFAEAVTLAHVARPIALASGLVAAGHDIAIACAASHSRFASACGLPVLALHSLQPAQFLAALAAGRPVYDDATLARYVDDDLRLMRAFQPDLVVGDFRLSLSVSARLAGLPYAAISNAYWSPACRLAYPLPELPLTRHLPLPLARLLFWLGRGLAMPRHCAPLNRLRRRHGLPGLGADLRNTYTDADHLLLADAPGLYPMTEIPAQHHFLGPVLWSPVVELPPWWRRLPAERPMVYLSLGSSGSGWALRQALQGLSGSAWTVMCATAQASVPAELSANLHLADYLPGEQATARADLVVCNGGSMSCQQALLAGRAILGIASNMDQFLNMSAIVAAGAGICLRADRVTPDAIRQACHALLGQPGYARASAQLGEQLRQFDAVERFRALLPTLARRGS